MRAARAMALSIVLASVSPLLAPAASAADLGGRSRIVHPDPGPLPVAFSWAGFYIGVHAGYGWSSIEWQEGAFVGSHDGEGGLAGGQIGFNLQFGRLVYGLEADAAASLIEGGSILSSHSLERHRREACVLRQRCCNRLRHTGRRRSCRHRLQLLALCLQIGQQLRRRLPHGRNRSHVCDGCRHCRLGDGGYGGDSYGGGGYSSGGYGGGGYGGGGSYDRAPRQMYDAVCADCGRTAQVPFQPTGSRPVYCNDCFRARR